MSTNLKKITNSMLQSLSQNYYDLTFIANIGGPGQLSQYSDYAMGWTVRGSNPGGGEIFHTCPDWPWAPPSQWVPGLSQV
jgi:hypothetical protein